MATATKNETIGRFTVSYDPCDGYDWHVLDAEGYAQNSLETRDEAIAYAREMEEAAAEEEREAAEEDARDAAQAAREATRDKIRDLLDGCEDDAKLAAVLAMLGG